MKVSDVCKSYFSGFQEASNCKKNDNKTNALAFLKILSYFTIVIPLEGFRQLCSHSSPDSEVKDKFSALKCKMRTYHSGVSR